MKRSRIHGLMAASIAARTTGQAAYVAAYHAGQPAAGGDALKAKGQARVAAANSGWMDRALRELREWVGIRRHLQIAFTMDGFRNARASLTGDPEHVNAWGALPRAAIKQGIIAPTGNMVKAKRPKAHSRMVKEYVAA